MRQASNRRLGRLQQRRLLRRGHRTAGWRRRPLARRRALQVRRPSAQPLRNSTSAWGRKQTSTDAQTVLIVNDLVTALLLFVQLRASRSAAVQLAAVRGFAPARTRAPPP